jgi:hypothetical protein
MLLSVLVEQEQTIYDITVDREDFVNNIRIKIYLYIEKNEDV